MSTPALYFHTVRHLRPIQIAARVWQRVHHSKADLSPPPRLRHTDGAYVAPILHSPSLVGPDLFRFLNVDRRCSGPADWSPTGAATLWAYHLHYFDDLNARDGDTRTQWHRALLERWVTENEPGRAPGWEPYPVSLRIVNWVKWALRNNELPPRCHSSLAVQARWLLDHLEYHLLGNHLFANAKGLIHAGLYFEGSEAEGWLARGLEILAREVPEQILEDGGHFELSPMYHAVILEDLLDVSNVLQTYGRQPPAPWLEAIGRMRRWLQAMCHPDGEISLFNDAAVGTAATPTEIEAYALRLGLGPSAQADQPLIALRQSGYVRCNTAAACLIADCGSVGPDYLPGHAHADTLSFELSLHDRRLFVNSGTSEYGTSQERQRQRGTAAHNTVVVDGEDSSEVWGGFRVARRARAQLRSAAAGPPAILEASHDGYRRLPGRNRHLRRWVLDRRSLRIEDHVSGEASRIEARFHLHPEARATLVSEREAMLTLPDTGSVRFACENSAALELRPSTWHPRFGVSIDNQCLVARFATDSLITQLRWGDAP